MPFSIRKQLKAWDYMYSSDDVLLARVRCKNATDATVFLEKEEVDYNANICD